MLTKGVYPLGVKAPTDELKASVLWWLGQYDGDPKWFNEKFGIATREEFVQILKEELHGAIKDRIESLRTSSMN